MMTKAELTSYIKAEALRLGFDVCGISQAKAVDETAVEIQTDWVKQGKHATMQYMERNPIPLPEKPKHSHLLFFPKQ